jgi:hypothetical protein
MSSRRMKRHTYRKRLEMNGNYHKHMSEWVEDVMHASASIDWLTVMLWSK